MSANFADMGAFEDMVAKFIDRNAAGAFWVGLELGREGGVPIV